MLKLRGNCTTVSGPKNEVWSEVANYQPIRPEVTLSSTFLLVTSTALVLLTLFYWTSFGFFLYISIGPLEPMYGFTYYSLSSTYCLLASLVTLKRLWKLAQSGPTSLARMGLFMLTVTFIEYLIFTNVLYSRQQMDDLYGNDNKCTNNNLLSILSFFILLSDYNLQSVFIIVSSVGRLLCATLVYFLLRNVLSEIAWDVGDPLS